jgi:hypothetical protein
MKNPSTTVELAGAIESLIGGYVDEVREAAQQAVARALARSAGGGRHRRSGRKAFSRSRTSTSRRTTTELANASDALCEVVRTHPGASMVALAEELDVDARTLQRPMARLKSVGRVRSVGQRHLTRYYPAVVRPGADKD